MAVERRMGEREKSKDRDSTSTQTEADSVLYRANWRKVLHGECLRHSLRQSSMIADVLPECPRLELDGGTNGRTSIILRCARQYVKIERQPLLAKDY